MWPWDDEEDDQVEQAPAAPRPAAPPPPAAPAVGAARPLDPEFKAQLLKRWGEASDDGGVRAAEADSKRANLIAGIAEGLGRMATAGSVARGGPGVDSKMFQPIRDAGRAGVEDARRARGDKIQAFEAEDRIGQQVTERSRADQEFEQKAGQWKRDEETRRALLDPNSAETAQRRELAAKLTGRPVESFSDRNGKQLDEAIPRWEMIYKIDQHRKQLQDAAAERRAARDVAAEGSWHSTGKTDDQGRIIYVNSKTGAEKLGETTLVTSPNGPTPAAKKFKGLPPEDQKVIEKLAGSNADKISIANQIEAVMAPENWDKLTEDEKLQQGRQLIKVLNSTQGQDAVGAEEAKRLAGKLDFAMGNLTNNNPIQFGRDLPGFANDSRITLDSIRKAVKANEGEIQKRYGREPAPTGPKPGDIEDGHVFKGGDPSNPNNWEPVP